ncbi:MAG TPA: histidine kinase [Gemmatimonadales bacterium]|jgi:signal transduction histidine kinase
MSRRVQITSLAALLATAIGGVFAVQEQAVMLAAGRPISFAAAFATQAVPWYIWVLFVPIILYIPDRWPVCPGLVRLLAINISLGLTLTGIHLFLSHAILTTLQIAPGPVPLGFPGLGPPTPAQVAGGMMIYGVLVGLAYLAHYSRAFHESQVQSAQLKAQVVTAELTALRAQLCPHFLFNTLNSACGLIPSEPERAELMITRLSQLLRFALQSEGIAEVPLSKEIEFARAYLDVERIRFQDRLHVAIHVDPEVRDVLVPNFLLQPLVENAVHHAVAPSREPRTLELIARRERDSLVIEVRDDGPGLRPGAIEHRREAIGLKTTRARLEHLYGTGFSFAVRNRSTGGAEAEVIIPLRPARVPEPLTQPQVAFA